MMTILAAFAFGLGLGLSYTGYRFLAWAIRVERKPIAGEVWFSPYLGRVDIDEVRSARHEPAPGSQRLVGGGYDEYVHYAAIIVFTVNDSTRTKVTAPLRAFLDSGATPVTKVTRAADLQSSIH